jgi:hypothetical protein
VSDARILTEFVEEKMVMSQDVLILLSSSLMLVEQASCLFKTCFLGDVY